MPTIIVIWIAKLAGWLSTAFGRGEGGALPGLIAEKLQPDILSKLGSKLSKGSVLITGTNGKTTATRMVVAALGQSQGRVLSNRAGSNLTRGLISHLVAGCSLSGRMNYDFGVFEVDEAAFPEAFKALKPQAAMVLNLFRDQLDRYGELNTLAAKLRQALEGTPANIILNGDDPLVAWLGRGLKNASYFGIESAPVKKLPHDFAADSSVCPVCASPLRYESIYYSHIGSYDCPTGDFHQPKLNVVGKATLLTTKSSVMEIHSGQKRAELELQLPGLYNLYNALGSIQLAMSLGVGLESAVESVVKMPAAFGRAEVVTVDDKQVELYLVKNPTGFNQIIQTYLLDPKSQPLLIIINDLIADGRDVSWLWDVAFEDVGSTGQLSASGLRAYDLALRLKYAGLKSEPLLDIDAAIERFIDQIPLGGSGIILPTYTAMLATRRSLGRSTPIARMN
ncbi:MAG TPA: MurT ligase domain-containing protein [Candidatus Saccharimonadales bacterium]|nr:MurT ligase domain-containing protein [Candidatus Saccharimonadales bacterium]